VVARADLILSIVRAAQEGDDVALRRTVEALIAEEREKQHHVLAERLEQALQSNGTGSVPVAESPRAAAPVEVINPNRRLGELLLPATIRMACDELIEEQQRVEVLRSFGLEPRHRVLLTGPPGNGKTSLAEAIAESLLLPLMKVRYEAVVGSFLGETAAALSRVFSFARTRRTVLFFDEFDAIAKERGDEHETGEVKRVVSSLLMQVDALPSHVVVIAASNHPELLDRAVGRRFELHLHLPRPDLKARTEWFEGFVDSFDARISRTPASLAKATAGASFSSLEQLTLDIRRRHTLNPEKPANELVAERLKRWKQDVAAADGS
jgi:ATPase family associated with various cellular activities (AAA)